jgi:hypothetical protein
MQSAWLVYSMNHFTAFNWMQCNALVQTVNGAMPCPEHVWQARGRHPAVMATFDATTEEGQRAWNGSESAPA